MKNQRGFARHHSESGFVHIILILVIVVVAIGGAYYFGTLKTKSDISSFIPTSTPVVSTQPVVDPTAESTTDPTANWETYINEQYGFSFKYPNTWLTQILVKPRYVNLSNKGVDFFVTINENVENINDWYTKNDAGKFVKLKHFFNTNIYVMNGGTQLSSREYAFIIPDNNLVRFVVEPVEQDERSLKSVDDEFDQILSTFQFTK